MPKYGFEHNGKRYAVTANNPDEAGPMIDDVIKHLSGTPDKFGMLPDPNAKRDIGAEISRSVASQDPIKAFSEGTGSKAVGTGLKGLDYLTGIPSLGKTAAELGNISRNPQDLLTMEPKEKASLGARTLMGGAMAPGIAAFGIPGMLKGAAKAAPGLALYNETGLSEKVGAGIDKALPTSPYLAEAAKMVPQVLAGGASTAGINLGLKASGVGAPMKPVEKGQEAKAFTDLAKKEFGAPETFGQGDISKKGNLRAALKGERSELGAELGETRAKLAEAIDANPEFDAASLSTKLKHAINRSLSPKDLKANPSAAKALTELANEADVTTFAEAQGVAERLESILKKTLKPNDPANSLASPIWGRANSAVKSVLDKQAKEFGATALEEVSKAKQPFGQWATLQDLTNKAFTGGEFSPNRFIENWKSLSDAEKSTKLKPEQVAAIDAMVKQPEAGMLQKIGGIIGTGAQLTSSRLGVGGGLAALLANKPEPIRFNAPTGKTAPTVKTDLGAGALSSARADQLRKSKLLQTQLRWK